MREISPPVFRNGRFEIVVEAGGRLPLPVELVQPLGLAPGDLVALEPVTEEEWKIRFYRQVLTFPWEAAPEARWWFTMELLRNPLTALDQTGALVLPPEILPFSEGDRMHLQVLAPFGTSWPTVYLKQISLMS